MRFSSIVAAALISAVSFTVAAGDMIVGNGMKVAFLGDSITQQGAAYPCGYLNLVADGLKRAGVEITVIPAGISGNKSTDMLARLDKVLAQKPDVMTLSCGVNDVWHFDWKKGVPLEDYKANIRKIVETAGNAGVKVVIMTSTMVKENELNGEKNKQIAIYNDFLRELAKEKNLPVADESADMLNQVKTARENKKYAMLTRDGVHMTKKGNIMMAANVLRAFGMPEEKVLECMEAWKTFPESTVAKPFFQLDEWRRIEAAAKAENKTVDAYVKDAVVKALPASSEAK